MINFHYEIAFELGNENYLKTWITKSVDLLGKELGELNYIFCDDAYLLKLNKEYLQHDTFTDIISFDYTVGSIISGDVYISIPRVRENAITFEVSFEEELKRVLIHGVLHYAGFKDKTKEEAKEMRKQENHYLRI